MVAGATDHAFDLDGDERGVLCLHGFTGTPFEVRHLGHMLHRRGMTVVGPALPGHATNPADLDRTTWRHWYDAVEDDFGRLRQRCDTVAVVGLSLGGLLALHLAVGHHDEVSAISSLAAPLWLPQPAKTAVSLFRRFPTLTKLVPRIRKRGGSDIRDRRARAATPSYSEIPTRALGQLVEFMEIVRDELAAVRTPLLVVHAVNDHTAPVACGRYLRSHVSSSTVRLRELKRSYHVVAIDVERDIVAAEVGTFFEAHQDRKAV